MYIYRNLVGKKEGRHGPKDGQNNGWEKEGQMEVRWLLTNRKHGGKTKSVSVLKAALRKRRDGKKTERRLLMIEREEETEKRYPNHYDKKKNSGKEDCRACIPYSHLLDHIA